MKHYQTNLVDSFVLFGHPDLPLQRQAAERIVWVLGYTGEFAEVITCYVEAFVFDGERDAASYLARRLAPSEFRSVLAVRKWYKAIDEQFKYRSPRFWTRTGDALIANINTERSVVFIDAHYWVD